MSLADTIRLSRSMRLNARRARSEAKALRASLRAQYLVRRKIVTNAQETRALIHAVRAIARARAARSPSR
jgi:hypothetical protein